MSWFCNDKAKKTLKNYKCKNVQSFEFYPHAKFYCSMFNRSWISKDGAESICHPPLNFPPPIVVVCNNYLFQLYRESSGRQSYFPEKYFTEGSRYSFLADNLTIVARKVFRQKRVVRTQGKVIFAKLLCLTTLPGKLKYIILSTVMIMSE